jgi:succinoglycan biosynthesis protein ExoM
MTGPGDSERALRRITVCICTYQRPRMLQRLLEALEVQQANGRYAHNVVVADNDPARSARAVVDAFSARSMLKVTYGSEPRKNIALARNLALSLAEGEFVAFIDDDEFPEPDWLLRMLQTCEQQSCAGVLGPVRLLRAARTPHWPTDALGRVPYRQRAVPPQPRRR